MAVVDALLKPIPITDIEGFRIGHAQNDEAGTGLTVIICEEGAHAGVDVRGGGPASRETELLKPVAGCDVIHGLVLSGGSAFGLDAAGGVMRFLADKGIGLQVTPATKVPLVVQSDIFDLSVAMGGPVPDADMARAACEDAFAKSRADSGNIGAGTGCTVGKVGGFETAMKTGLGVYAVQVGELKVGAIVALNAMGDVFDIDTGERIAGMLDPAGGFADTEAAFYATLAATGSFYANTTIAAVLTNASFDKTTMNKVAAVCSNGLVRAINPVNTTGDGDSVYALSCGNVEADKDVVGTLGARVLGRAIADAVRSVESAYGLKAACDL